MSKQQQNQPPQDKAAESPTSAAAATRSTRMGTPHSPDATSRRLRVAMDFQLKDDGTALVSITPVDHKGLDTVLPDGSPAPTFTSSNAGLVVTADPSNPLQATLAPSDPPTLVTAAVITVECTLPNGDIITGTSDPIDVVAGDAAGFRVVLATV